MRYAVNSLMMAVNPSGGFNSYWPMPFRKRARITVENQRPEDIPGLLLPDHVLVGAGGGGRGVFPRVSGGGR